MNRKLASALSIAITAAAGLAAAAIASGNAYADDITTIDTKPFISTKTRAEVRAEAMDPSLTSAASEWAMQLNYAPQSQSSYTREQATAEYIAARNEVNSRNAEDSGSSYLATHRHGMRSTVITAGAVVR